MNDFYSNKDINSGRIQKAVDTWSKEAEVPSNSASPKDEDNYLGNDIKNKIKENISEINANKKSAALPIKEPEKTMPENVAASGSSDYSSTFAKAKQQKDDNIYSQTEKVKRTADRIRLNQEKTQEDEIDKVDDLIEEQRALKHSLILKFIFCSICTAFLVFFAVVPLLKVSLPPFIDATVHPKIFLGCNFAFLLAVGLAGHSVAFKGIASLFTFKPDADSITSLSFIAALIGNIYLFAAFYLNGTAGDTVSASIVFSACAAAAVSFNIFGKIFIVARVKHNLEFLSRTEKSDFYSAQSLEGDEAKAVFRIFDGTPNVVTAKKVKYVSDYIDSAYSQSPSDTSSRVLSLAVLIAAFVAALIQVILKKDIPGALILFTAVCSVASPLLLEFGVSVPFYRCCKKLTKQNTLITGCETLEEFDGTDAIVADSTFLFRKNGIKIHGIKTFSNMKIDDAVLYASSAAKAGRSPLYSAFAGMFQDPASAEKYLRPAERVTYEDERGLYAIIDNKAVLLGNRRLLRHHMVESPSRDFEIRSCEGGKNVVYLAIDGKLAAMFIVEYNFDSDSLNCFKKLSHFGVHLLIDSSDPNVTPLLLEEKAGISSKTSLVLGASEMSVLNNRKDGGINSAGLAFKDAAGYIAGIISCIKLNGGIMANTSLQFIFSIIGAVIVICCSLFGGGIKTVLPAYVLIFQLISAVPILLISLFRRN